jgi:hypothetical protein
MAQEDEKKIVEYEHDLAYVANRGRSQFREY